MSNDFIKLAYNDVMTGTLNKKALETYCAFVTEKIQPERVSTIIFDVDDFKSYNDHYSHMKGDEALKRIAESVAGELLGAVRAAAIAREDLPDKSIVTASFEVACGSTKELSDLSVITKADRQLYVGKNGGKDCVAANDVIYNFSPNK